MPELEQDDTMQETLDKVRNERDQLRSQVAALRPDRDSCKAEAEVLRERTEALGKELQLAKNALGVSEKLKDESVQAKLHASSDAKKVSAALDAATALALETAQRRDEALRRDADSFATLTAVMQTAARFINMRGGVDPLPPSSTEMMAGMTPLVAKKAATEG